MCNCSFLTRRHIILGLSAAAVMPIDISVADGGNISVLGGQVAINGNDLGTSSASPFTLSSAASGGVIQSRDQIFYLDPQSEADFYRTDDGLVSQIVIKTGGLLSLFGPERRGEIEIKTPNAVGAIRGTTTYFAWQEEERRSYVCCCYGGVDLSNNAGGEKVMRTRYHNAVILPLEGGVAPAPYDRPLAHYDDDIAALEERAGRTPRWDLPNNSMNFFAPHPVPLD